MPLMPCLTIAPIHDETRPALITPIALKAIWVIYWNGQEQTALRTGDFCLASQATGEAEFE